MRALLAATILAWSMPALAETKTVSPEVQRHFDLGNDLYGEGRYEDALIEYEKAYSLSKYWKILYNRGQALVMLRREPEAIEDFERYLEEGGADISEERRKEVQADVEKLKRRLASVTLKNAPAGLDVLLDGRAIGKTPLAKPIAASAGKHTFGLRRGPDVVFAKEVQIAAGENAEIAVEIAPEPKKPEPVAPPKPVEPGGLVNPAFPIALALGVAAPMRNVAHGRIDILGAVDLYAGWRWHPLWSLGFFLGGASGKVELGNPQDNVDSLATYSYGMGGVRARLHLLRDPFFDGWLGFDFGVWRETWKFNSVADYKFPGFEWAATSPAFGLSGGIDFPVAKSWALGGGMRIFGTFVNSGDRVGCTNGDDRCNISTLPFSEGGGKGVRGFFEVSARLTYSISYGSR